MPAFPPVTNAIGAAPFFSALDMRAVDAPEARLSTGSGECCARAQALGAVPRDPGQIV